ncbi:hypothetical protein PRUPE_7G146700 [Prunus persica]|uniref:Transmembrane protein 220 n=1 Tax=Prunus persica TaxID=3760 RepID=M5VUK2_PRUPE|nr:uncharacterized protein LOC18771800 isoform X2 [Prunus persica]ONH96702.1 hypothetical protein PRUPE_7G146700 [Prunus persica]
MATPTKLNILCSLLMASLFGYSASVQLDDSDWYFWFSLYGGACVVNLVNWAISSKAIKHVAEGALWLGIFLFIRVIAESTLVDGVSGFWSLDLSERVIREKIGSGLVIISMILQLTASSLEAPPHKQQNKFPRYVEYGMAILVGFSYGLPFVFFVVQKGELKF